MQGTIDSIEARTTKNQKPYHLVKIDGGAYWAWEANVIKDVSEGDNVDFEYDGDEYPKLVVIKKAAGGTGKPKQTSKYDDTKVWNTCLMCAKDIVVACIQAGTVPAIKTTVIDYALAFYHASENGVTVSQSTPEATNDKPPKDNDLSKLNDNFDGFQYQLTNTAWQTKAEIEDWWNQRQKSFLKLTEDERKKLIKTYSEELSKTK